MALTDATPAELLTLSGAAHWNQTEEDWRAMLAMSQGLAWGVRVRDEAGGGSVLVASTLVLPYRAGEEVRQAPFAWISMVLVLPPWRGRGFAGALLRRALDELATRRLQPVLDATPAGRPVYLRQGFVDGWGFTRWRRKAVAGADVAPPARGPMTGLRSRRPDDWPAIEALDRPAFGANRMPLLRLLSRRLPQAAWVAERQGLLRGYLLGRDGRTALQLGPLVADDDRTALALLQAALPAVGATAAASGRDVIVDLRDPCRGIAAWLQGVGFAAERPFTRMVRGGGPPPGDAARLVLMAGPELG